MTAQEFKVHVKDPASKYRRFGYVTLKAVPSALGRSWEVYDFEGDRLLGTVTRRTHTPHTKYPGTRIRKDLAPRTVWDANPAGGAQSRLGFEKRNDALHHLIKENPQ